MCLVPVLLCSTLGLFLFCNHYAGEENWLSDFYFLLEVMLMVLFVASSPCRGFVCGV